MPGGLTADQCPGAGSKGARGSTIKGNASRLPKRIPRSKGSYVLLLRIPEEQAIPVGKLGSVDFPAGYYAYIGSALGGIKARLSHHLQGKKKLHWHIDYLLEETSISSIIICESEHRLECVIAQTLSQRFPSIPGFGASDCHCPSHLFFASRDIKEEIKQEIMTMLNSLGLKPRWIENLSRGAAYLGT